MFSGTPSRAKVPRERVARLVGAKRRADVRLRGE
jgi:hypothetical protein